MLKKKFSLEEKSEIDCVVGIKIALSLVYYVK